MSRRDDFELWREVSRSTVGLAGMVELFAKRVRREDRLDLAREMIEHSDELAARRRGWKVKPWDGGRLPSGCGRVAGRRPVMRPAKG